MRTKEYKTKIADEPFQPPNGQSNLICTNNHDPIDRSEHRNRRMSHKLVVSVGVRRQGRSRRKVKDESRVAIP